MLVADWRRITEDRPIDLVPADLRRRLAATAEEVARTFERGAQLRERLAAGSGSNVDYYRSRASWNRTVADFERRQAAALRAGRLLATPWRPVVAGRARPGDGQVDPATGRRPYSAP